MTKRILLALSSSWQFDRAADEAVRLARESGAALSILYVLEPKAAEAAFDELTDVGLIGEKPGAELTEAFMRECRKQAYLVISQIEEKCRASAVSFDSMIQTGKWADEVIKVCASSACELVVAPEARQSRLSRLLFGSSLEELKKRAPCEVRVVSE